jgi:SpoIID/LytB domain protein
VRVFACSAIVALALCAGVAAPAQARPAKTLVIAGAGDGHGVGMSQYGALGYAQHGYTYQAILAHYYTGTTIGQAPANAIVKVLDGNRVRKVPLERYVRGVVSAEMPASWPPAALEAQAIASRTYALTAHAGGSRFDVYSDTRSQMYRGVAAETAQTNAAIAATAGQILTYAGQPAITYFSASSGGMTEDVQNAFQGSEPKPWLVGVPDPYDAGPQFEWTVTMSFAKAARRLRGLVKGRLLAIEVLQRGVSPRILTAAIVGSKGRTEIGGAELAARLGLQSTWAHFSVRTGHGQPKPEPESSAAATAPPPAGPAEATLAGATSASAASAGGTSAGATPAGNAYASAASAGGTLAGDSPATPEPESGAPSPPRSSPAGGTLAG